MNQWLDFPSHALAFPSVGLNARYPTTSLPTQPIYRLGLLTTLFVLLEGQRP